MKRNYNDYQQDNLNLLVFQNRQNDVNSGKQSPVQACKTIQETQNPNNNNFCIKENMTCKNADKFSHKNQNIQLSDYIEWTPQQQNILKGYIQIFNGNYQEIKEFFPKVKQQFLQQMIQILLQQKKDSNYQQNDQGKITQKMRKISKKFTRINFFGAEDIEETLKVSNKLYKKLMEDDEIENTFKNQDLSENFTLHKTILNKKFNQFHKHQLLRKQIINLYINKDILETRINKRKHKDLVECFSFSNKNLTTQKDVLFKGKTGLNFLNVQ